MSKQRARSRSNVLRGLTEQRLAGLGSRFSDPDAIRLLSIGSLFYALFFSVKKFNTIIERQFL